MISTQLTKPTVETIEVGLLARYERPLAVMNSYDQLLREVSSEAYIRNQLATAPSSSSSAVSPGSH
jgi:hypothetical protein